MRVGPVGPPGPYRELEPEWPFLTEANGERTAWLAVQQAVAVDLGVMLHQIPGTPWAERLLVRDRGERQPSLQMVADTVQVIVSEDRGRCAGLHVRHPAAVDLAVCDCPAPRAVRPVLVLLVDREHVHVAVEHQMMPGRWPYEGAHDVRHGG